MKKTKQAKKLFSMLLVLTMLLSGIPVFTAVSAVDADTQDSITEVLPYTDFSTDITAIADGGLWLKAGSDKVEEGMLKVAPSSTGAGGGSYVFDNLGESFAEADHSNIDDTYSVWRTYKHVFKTQVTLLQKPLLQKKLNGDTQ